ncbi:hypothetical protein EXIGLDRAFT_185744 [Exidia glandulosa HHB12029]|uniref:Uncharacterized protein n=1 Tax=Exidia glandulosa HHB12029 TaxID=1314781 RepID=A0A166A2W9_EXIGL|nr:hypothetical protein EXIGLDRAFT_185744 [Exidia glandulosa HHB12029]
MSLALVIGLGVRLLLQKLQSSATYTEAAFDPWHGERLLSGVWQGALAHYVSSAAPQLSVSVLVGITGRVLFALAQIVFAGIDAEPQSATALAATLLGIAFGVLLAEISDIIYARVFPPTATTKPRAVRRVSSPAPPSISSGDSRLRPAAGRIVPRSPEDEEPQEDVASHTLHHLELEIAELQAEAAAAGAQRRRFEEERKWALEQGNFTWASQLAWQIQRCDALERSYAASSRAKMRELEGDAASLLDDPHA